MPAAAFAEDLASEHAVKAALWFKLPLFVYRATAERDNTLRLCLLGRNPFGDVLERLALAPIDKKSVRYIHLRRAEDADDCDFVFISRSEAGRIDSVLSRLDRPALVTASDIEGFARSGGMVEFALLPERPGVTLLVNRIAAQRRGVEFNAQLLRLAKVVE